ncbi:hypothetical protein CYMTET_6075 [Cymbomonas tetramitiformis]|uniref:EGF-like domain-containing protein n=1 Tax=Cymbomonas tetramitiformis TaxID=36881 RepID=A0AAE0GY00_9CHLO|nr:hypothetical protein CYMTET_6075 [Cymbomonas tetramitiformis]
MGGQTTLRKEQTSAVGNEMLWGIFFLVVPLFFTIGIWVNDELFISHLTSLTHKNVRSLDAASLTNDSTVDKRTTQIEDVTERVEVGKTISHLFTDDKDTLIEGAAASTLILLSTSPTMLAPSAAFVPASESPPPSAPSTSLSPPVTTAPSVPSIPWSPPPATTAPSVPSIPWSPPPATTAPSVLSIPLSSPPSMADSGVATAENGLEASTAALAGNRATCHPKCHERGTCNEVLGRCDCPTGWTGPDCTHYLSMQACQVTPGDR